MEAVEEVVVASGMARWGEPAEEVEEVKEDENEVMGV